jgi:hypothetical protein
VRRAAAVLGVLVVIGLAGCGERDQSLASSKRKADTPAWQSDTSSFAAPGYAPGDRGAWEQQLRNRAQAQNDFAVPK